MAKIMKKVQKWGTLGKHYGRQTEARSVSDEREGSYGKTEGEPAPPPSCFSTTSGQKCELWLCGCAFTLADVLLGATLHRLKFLGLSKKYWEDGSRPNLQSFFERVQKRFAFRKVLGDIHTTLLSAVIHNAFRMVKRKPPSFFGASFLMGSLGGMGYFAYWYLKKKYI